MSEDDINKECDSILDDYVNKHFGGSQKKYSPLYVQVQ